MLLLLLVFMSIINHLFLILRLKWLILLLLVQILRDRNLRSHSHLLDGVFGKLVIIGSRRVAAVRRVLIRSFFIHVNFKDEVFVVISSLILALSRFLAQSPVCFILVK